MYGIVCGLLCGRNFNIPNCIITSNKTKANKLKMKRERERERKRKKNETKHISCMSEILHFQNEKKNGDGNII